MVVPSAETDFLGDFRRKTYHLNFFFFFLRRIKTYLRSSVTQQRLNNAMLISVYKLEADALYLTTIASQFFSANKYNNSNTWELGGSVRNEQYFNMDLP